MISAFLPCRKGSQRIEDKNVREFAGIKGGLLEIKLKQLLNVIKLDQIIVSSNDDRVLDYALKVKDSRIKIDERPDKFGSSDTTTDSLISYVPSILKEGEVLWTHVTSPFIDENDYIKIINTYYGALEKGYDSLMTAHKIQGFLWKDGKPFNYSNRNLKWPFTQSIDPVYEIDSGAFLANIDSYILGDRVGNNPFLYEQDKIKTIDIDWPSDFKLAELIWRMKS